MACERDAELDERPKRAMDIMFTQGVDQAEEYLLKETSSLSNGPSMIMPRLKMNCTISYVRFVKALMTWDEDVIDDTIKFVKSVEKTAESQLKGGAKKADQIEAGIIEADCVLIRGMLTFTRMSLPAYIKAGFHLRSASKGYDKMLKEVEKLEPSRLEEQIKSMKKANSVVIASLKEASEQYSLLKASVTMGYGLLNLIMSLIPDKILVVIKLLGFSAKREAALKALNFCSQTNNMRSPIAKLVLLWHHSVTRPSFGLDGDNLIAGVEEAQRIMTEASSVYHESPLFLYFRGRIAYLKKDTSTALKAFLQSVSLSEDQREIKHVNLYEIGFCHIINLDWNEAAEAFCILKSETRWSVGYYSYLYALCLAAKGDTDAATAELRNIPTVIKHKNSNYEKFVLRRSALHLKMGLKDYEGLLFALQLSYQWSQIAYLNNEQCEKLLQTVKDIQPRTTSNTLMEAICVQLQGVFLMQMQRYDDAEKCFRVVLEKAKECVSRKEQQAPAFATYEIGRIYFKRGEVEKAKAALTKAKSSYGDYEVESRLQAKVQSLLQFIKKGGKPERTPLPGEDVGSNDLALNLSKDEQGESLPSPASSDIPDENDGETKSK